MSLWDHILAIDVPLILVLVIVLVVQLRHGHYIKDIHVHFNGKDKEMNDPQIERDGFWPGFVTGFVVASGLWIIIFLVLLYFL